MQGELVTPCLEPQGAEVNPLPAAAGIADWPGGEVLVDGYAELAGPRLRCPGRRPVIGAQEQTIDSAGLRLKRGGGVGNGYAQSMRHEIRRTHEVHELLVGHPASLIGHLLGFNQHFVGL